VSIFFSLTSDNKSLIALQHTSLMGWTIGQHMSIVSPTPALLNGKELSKTYQIMAISAELVPIPCLTRLTFSGPGEPSPLLRVVEAWCRSSHVESVDQQDLSSDN
jgi:hypothetical protein